MNESCSLYINTYFVALKERDVEVLEQIPLLNLETIPMFFKTVCEVVILSMKNKDLSLANYEVLGRNFSALMGNVQTFEHQKSIITLAVKFGKKFVDTFLGHLSKIHRFFKHDSERVSKMFKSLQIGTKILQVCFMHAPINHLDDLQS